MPAELLTNVEVRTALQGSIKKWEKIAAGIGKDFGSHNCPLCYNFLTVLAAAENTDCNGCPVKEYSGKKHCAFTPYGDWIYRRSNESIRSSLAVTDDDKLLALAELDFLKMLDRHYFRDM